VLGLAARAAPRSAGGAEADPLARNGKRHGMKAGRSGVVQPAIGEEQRGIRAVELESFLVYKKDGDARAVLAAAKNLFGFEIIGMEAGNFGRAVDGGFARGELVSKNGGRVVEGCIEIERVGVSSIAMKTVGTARAGKSDFIFQAAGKAVDGNAAGHVLEINGHELPAHGVDALQSFSLFGNDVFPGRFGIGGIVKHDAGVGGGLGGGDQGFIAKVVDYGGGVVGDIGDNRRKVFFFFGQVAEINGVAALALALIGDFQDRETLVVSGVYVFEAVGIFLVLVNEFVGGLRRAENVVIDALGVVFRRELVAGYRGFEGAI